MSIRRMSAPDMPAVLAVVAGLPEWFDSEARERTIPTDLRHHATFVAEESGRIVGFITLHVCSGRLEISWMGVAPERRRSGIGRALLVRAEQLAAEWGLEEMSVMTLGDSVDYQPYESTRRFYLANGFEIRQRNLTDNPGCPEEWRLRKRILQTDRAETCR
jgi:GNAT superfamily N-acetyltransferase